jgi:hypothetical protein
MTLSSGLLMLRQILCPLFSGMRDEQAKDVEILALGHQIALLHRQVAV